MLQLDMEIEHLPLNLLSFLPLSNQLTIIHQLVDSLFVQLRLLPYSFMDGFEYQLFESLMGNLKPQQLAIIRVGG